MITASHNPAPYNGFKLVLGPLPVREEEVAHIASLVGEKACVRAEGPAAHASGGIRARGEDRRRGGASPAIVEVASTCGEYSCVRGDPPRGVDQ